MQYNVKYKKCLNVYFMYIVSLAGNDKEKDKQKKKHFNKMHSKNLAFTFDKFQIWCLPNDTFYLSLAKLNALGNTNPKGWILPWASNPNGWMTNSCQGCDFLKG